MPGAPPDLHQVTFRTPSVARSAALLAALCLGLPAGIAVAQSDGTPTSESAPGLSTTPQTAPAEPKPAPVTTPTTPKTTATTETTPKASSLASTGSETWLVALAGGALLLVGGGLRLRVGGLRV